MLRGHGGEIYHLARQLGIPPREIQDHSSNVSPLPPPAGLYERLKESLAEIENLPEVDSFSLRSSLAEFYGLSPEEIIPSSGTTEWIFAIPRLLKPKRVLILGPTYSDYADAARINGLKILYLLAREEENFAPPLKELKASLRPQDLVFICNPNNPTGVLISPEALSSLVIKNPESFFVVDESYMDFVEGENSLLSLGRFPSNLIVLRSFSKIYRIPGLRLGYLVAKAPLNKVFWENTLPWAVNRLAQIAGLWLLERASSNLKKVKEFVSAERERIWQKLSKLSGIKIFPSRVHFFLLKLLEPRKAAAVWHRLLTEKHILVREASNFKGLEGEFLRFALKGQAENARLLKALEEVLCEKT